MMLAPFFMANPESAHGKESPGTAKDCTPSVGSLGGACKVKKYKVQEKCLLMFVGL